MRSTFHSLVTVAGLTWPDAPAVTHGDVTTTYAALSRRAQHVAAGLRGLGLSRGDRVGVYLEKRHETVEALFGTSAAGGVFVPVNPVLRSRQVLHILRDSGARVLVTSRSRLDTLLDLAVEAPGLEHVVVVDPADSPSLGPVAVHRWDQLGDLGQGQVLPSVIDADLCAILYTSGSTGGPKGVALTHRNVVSGAQSVNAYLGNSPSDIILAALPLSFDAGLSQLTTAFDAGSHVVLMNYLLPRDVVRLVAKHAVTGLTCVPPLWLQIADQDWGTSGTSLRYFANTGGRMPLPTLERLRVTFPDAAPFLMYGLTEAFRSTYLDPREVDTRPDSIGKAIPNAEVLVLDPQGNPCPPGVAGELVHRGALVALGYWNDPDRTAERFRVLPTSVAGWRQPEVAVWSGDLVRTDDEGFLYFVGRADEMIKTSGYRVSPAEIEEAVLATRLVRDVVALGVPDERLGQRILVVVTPVDGVPVDHDALRTALRREVPLYMLPSEVVEREDLPRGANGKHDRTLLRKELVP